MFTKWINKHKSTLPSFICCILYTTYIRKYVYSTINNNLFYSNVRAGGTHADCLSTTITSHSCTGRIGRPGRKAIPSCVQPDRFQTVPDCTTNNCTNQTSPVFFVCVYYLDILEIYIFKLIRLRLFVPQIKTPLVQRFYMHAYIHICIYTFRHTYIHRDRHTWFKQITETPSTDIAEGAQGEDDVIYAPVLCWVLN